MRIHKVVLMVIAPQKFREEEFLIPKSTFQENNIEVFTCAKDVSSAVSTDGLTINTDKILSEVDLNNIDALVFVGGPGATIYFNDLQIFNLLKKAVEKGKILGAIWIAPSILANAGVLKNIKATCYPSERNNLSKQGAILLPEHVVVDNLIVTADGPKSSKDFANEIVKLLSR